MAKELIISWSDLEPGFCRVYSNWPQYLKKLRPLLGLRSPKLIDTSTEKEFFFFRKKLSAAQEKMWKQEAEVLPEKEIYFSPLKLEERETIFLAEEGNPYWLRIFTEHENWLCFFAESPYAFFLEETLHPDGRSATILFPRSSLVLSKEI